MEKWDGIDILLERPGGFKVSFIRQMVPMPEIEQFGGGDNFDALLSIVETLDFKMKKQGIG